MTMDWKSLWRHWFSPKEYIKPTCPVCHEQLRDVPGTDTKECKNGHAFGSSMKRADLINEGDHHGEL